VLHIATAHSGSPRWIEIQARHLREHVPVPFQTWGSLALIDRSHGRAFDHLIEQKGPEAAKLNHLAVEISKDADEQDLLMFLDPDAFPIADPMPAIEQGLAQAQLIAVRRAENAGDPQPHPCFCVTTVGAWRRLAGDWSDGYPFTTAGGYRATDLGANLLRRLQLTATPWVPLLRSNPPRHDPLMFAIYGEIVYHHGIGEIARVHRLAAPRPLPIPSLPGVAGAARRLDRERLTMWERRLQRRTRRRSERIVEAIARGGPGWLAEVR
jgi:hypothetical protein